jgi:hypothetical protein
MWTTLHSRRNSKTFPRAGGIMPTQEAEKWKMDGAATAALAVVLASFQPRQQMPLPFFPTSEIASIRVNSESAWRADQPTTVAVLNLKGNVQRVHNVGFQETVAERFHQLAADWSNEVQNVSSLTAMAVHPKYRQIVGLGWDAVPLMLIDLQRNKRFWLPALHEITGIQPFDPGDAGNSKRMVNAWLRWGKNKRYIE